MSSGQTGNDRLGEIVDAFVERYRQGERPSIEDYARMYPEIAAELREVLGITVLIEEAKATDQHATTGWTDTDTATVTRGLEGLGDYRILRELGRGGMGIVYEAEQLSLGRRVALKVLPAAATLNAKNLKRFQAEARAVAGLHHTNIVPVYEIGVANGIHYFTMQYLPGHGLDKVVSELSRLRDSEIASPGAETQRALGQFSLTDVVVSLFSDQTHAEIPESRGREPEALIPQRRLAPSTAGHEHRSMLEQNWHYWHNVARIGLQIAEALDYAHRQGMVHRDVKPSNLLLDVHGMVWLTDFGLAKQDQQENLTQSGDLLGTLRYIAPEAFAGRFDARSDVYALGLTLYELVALVPARNASSREGLLEQIKRGDALPLCKSCPWVPLDLETIIHKAIAAQPERRYQTAGDMAADLRRFLNDQPIHARRVTTLERMERWCRRNPAISITAATAALAIVVTMLTALLLVNAARDRAELLAEARGRLAQDNAALAGREREARQRLQSALTGEAAERKRAETNMRQAEQARDGQEKAAREARAVSDFLVVDMLAAARPECNHGRQITVREMLDRAASRVGASFAQQPETEAGVRVAIGRAYYSLGLYSEAGQHLGTALELQRRLLGAEHLTTLKTQINLAAALYGKGKFAEVAQLEEKTLASLRRNFGPEQPEALEALGNLGANLHAQGKYPEAQKLFEEVLQKKTRVLGAENESTLATMSNLAVNLADQGKLAAAETLNKNVLVIYLRKYGAQSPSTLIAMNNLAVNLEKQGRHKEAERLYRQVLAAQRRLLGPEHPETLATINNLAVNLAAQGKPVDAAGLLQETAAALSRLLGQGHPSTITVVNNLAMRLMDQGKAAEVEKLLSRTAEIASQSLGAEHPTTVQILENLAQCLVNLGKLNEAEAALRKVLANRRQVLGPEHEKTLNATLELAAVMARLARYAEAQELYEEVLEIQRRTLGPEHASTLITMNKLAGMRLLQEHYADAQKGFSDLLEIVVRLKGRDNADALHVMYNLGFALAKDGKIAEARGVFEQASAIQHRVLGPKHPETLAIDQVLAGLREGRTDFMQRKAPAE
jgi:serine/threonine protein kinase